MKSSEDKCNKVEGGKRINYEDTLEVSYMIWQSLYRTCDALSEKKGPFSGTFLSAVKRRWNINIKATMVVLM